MRSAPPLWACGSRRGARSASARGATASRNGASVARSGKAESISEMFERLRASIPAKAWDGVPTDLVKNKKHYLYGLPKEGE